MTTQSQSLETNNKVLDLLTASGLNWSVSKTQNTTILPDGTQLLSESASIRRNDTNNELGVMGMGYEVLQNSEFAQMLVEAGGKVNLEFANGGEQDGGKRVFLQANLPTGHIGRSDLKRYITSVNSFDGSTSVGIGSTNTVIVCRNTFFMAYKALEKVKHTGSMAERIKMLVGILQIAIENEEKLMHNFNEIANLPLNDDIVERVLNRIFDIKASEKKAGELSTRKINQIKDFGNALNTSRIEQGDTVWSLFNGITRYTNHMAPSDAAKKDLGLYLMKGSGFNTNLAGYDEIMDWVSKNTQADLHLVR